MMIALLIAAACAILAGLVAIAYGMLLELSFGNTLILAGAFGLCSGMVVLAQVLVVHELRNIARKLGTRPVADVRAWPAMAPLGPAAGPADQEEVFAASSAEVQLNPSGSVSASPWREEPAVRDRPRQEPLVSSHVPPEQVEPTPPQTSRRRNLLFSSSVRKDRERPASPQGEGLADRDSPLAAEETEPAPTYFEDAWPKSERARAAEAAAQRRANRPPSTFSTFSESARSNGAAADRAVPSTRSEEPPAVTVIKSGVVDGMAYSLYSDGSIEAQMPEGLMRFASIDELRAHLDQRT
jgi:hypothetical protein